MSTEEKKLPKCDLFSPSDIPFNKFIHKHTLTIWQRKAEQNSVWIMAKALSGCLNMGIIGASLYFLKCKSLYSYVYNNVTTTAPATFSHIRKSPYATDPFHWQTVVKFWVKLVDVVIWISNSKILLNFLFILGEYLQVNNRIERQRLKVIIMFAKYKSPLIYLNNPFHQHQHVFHKLISCYTKAFYDDSRTACYPADNTRFSFMGLVKSVIRRCNLCQLWRIKSDN